MKPFRDLIILALLLFSATVGSNVYSQPSQKPFKSLRISPHANVDRDHQGKAVNIAGVECIVEEEMTDYLPGTHGRYVSVTRSSDGYFLYARYVAIIERDCEIFDKAMEYITQTNHAREISEGDVLPSYTYALQMDWKRNKYTPTCVWKDQGDFGPMKTTLISEDCSKIVATWELTSESKLVASIKAYLQRY